MESTMIADNKILLRPASPESNGYFSETETGHDIAFNSKTPKWLANISSRNHIFQLPDLSLPPLPIKMNHGHDPTAKVISECDVVYSPWSDVMYTSQRKKIVIFNLDSIPLVGHTVPSYYYDRPDTIHMDSASFDEACSNRDKLKMSPCLRSPISPCADDLGNYAMHMNHDTSSPENSQLSSLQSYRGVFTVEIEKFKSVKRKMSVKPISALNSVRVHCQCKENDCSDTLIGRVLMYWHQQIKLSLFDSQ